MPLLPAVHQAVKVALPETMAGGTGPAGSDSRTLLNLHDSPHLLVDLAILLQG